KSNKRKKIRIEDEESTEEEEILENEAEAFEKLLKDLSTPEIEEQLKEEENIEDMTLEGLFIRAEKGSRELVKYWFDVGKEFRNEIRKMKGKTGKKEKIIRSDIYNRMEKNLKGRTRNAIQLSLTRAESVYKLFEGIGGKQRINRMKNTCMNTIIKLKFREEVIQKIKMEIPIFYGMIGEDPKEWTSQVEKYLLKIEIKDDKRIFEIAKTHLLGNALQWLENEGMCVADWDKNEIKELRLKYRLIEKYSEVKDDEEIIKETVRKIKKILNKSGIWITEDDIIRKINFGFTKYVLGIEYRNIRDKDCEILSRLVGVIRNIKKKNIECWICGKKGHYIKECLDDQNKN
ncbi:hypothetical protein RhiirA4_472990, partial [Rhizophagus irregularis]